MELTLINLIYFGALNLMIVLVGYFFVRKALVWQAWILFLVSLAVIHVIFLNEHAIIRMLAIMATTFTGMKVIAVAESYKGKTFGLTFKKWAIFATGWVGMKAQPFETLGEKPLPDAWPKVRFGLSRLIAGLIVVFLARQAATLPIDSNFRYVVISVMLLVGCSLILHFGLLSISAGMWRLSGANTYYLFRTPAKAKTLNDFWSKRWNLAFSEMASISIFRPLKSRTGSSIALMTAFIFSGLLHELALSVPVNSGFGLPLLYFIIQGIMVLVEKILLKYKAGFLQNRALASLWVFSWLVLPIPLLFHAGFLKDILWPLAGITI